MKKMKYQGNWVKRNCIFSMTSGAHADDGHNLVVHQPGRQYSQTDQIAKVNSIKEIQKKQLFLFQER